MTKVLTISTLLIKLIWAALPIKLSIFLKINKRLTVQVCKSWHWVSQSHLCSCQAYYQSSYSTSFLCRPAFWRQEYSVRFFELELNSKGHRGLDEKLGKLSFWTIKDQVEWKVYRGRSILDQNDPALSTGESTDIYSMCWWPINRRQSESTKSKYSQDVDLREL